MRNKARLEMEISALQQSRQYLEAVGRTLRSYGLVDARRLVDGALYGIDERLEELKTLQQ